MKPYGQKREWTELEIANKYDRGENKKGTPKKKTRFWKKRARQKSKKTISDAL